MEIGGRLALIGCGKMGGAMLTGWLQRGLPSDKVTLIEPNAEAVAPYVAMGCRHLSEAASLTNAPRVVVLAVKPQVMGEALAGLAQFVDAGTLFVSIAAGVTLARYREALGGMAHIVRAMPNTPAAVGRAVSVLVAGPDIGQGERELAQMLLAAVGETAWVEEESLLDAVTALSGSGPAYVFLLAEAMAEAGIAAGLPADLAQRLARGTVTGAGELLYQAEESAAQLRQNVTSPAGTTHAALQVLMAEDALPALMTRAIAAAAQRSRELAG